MLMSLTLVNEEIRLLRDCVDCVLARLPLDDTEKHILVRIQEALCAQIDIVRYSKKRAELLKEINDLKTIRYNLENDISSIKSGRNE